MVWRCISASRDHHKKVPSDAITFGKDLIGDGFIFFSMTMIPKQQTQTWCEVVHIN